MFLYLPKLLIRHLEDFLLGPKCNKLLCLQAHTLLLFCKHRRDSGAAFSVNYRTALWAARGGPAQRRRSQRAGLLEDFGSRLGPGLVTGERKEEETGGRLRQ